MKKEIVLFMAEFFAETECWINPEIKVDIDTNGCEFKAKEGVKGLVVFGENYPLSNRDLPIKDHLNVHKAIVETKHYGIVISDGNGKKMYVGNKLDIRKGFS